MGMGSLQDLLKLGGEDVVQWLAHLASHMWESESAQETG